MQTKSCMCCDAGSLLNKGGFSAEVLSHLVRTWQDDQRPYLGQATLENLPAYLPQHGSAAPAMSASKIGSLGQQAGPSSSPWACTCSRIWPPGQNHHHMSQWEERLMDQPRLQDGAAARDSLQLDVRQQLLLENLTEEFGNLS